MDHLVERENTVKIPDARSRMYLRTYQPPVSCGWRSPVRVGGRRSSEGERPVLTPRLVARVGDPIHFLTVTIQQSDQAASGGERNGDGEREPAHGARRNDAVEDHRVAFAIEQTP